MNSHQNFVTNETILIAGMGPAGLAAACEAILSDKKVIIVTNRPETEQTRARRVMVNEENLPYLRSLFTKLLKAHHTLTREDEAFINDIDYSSTLVLKKLEKFLLRRVQQYRTDGYPVIIIDNSEIKSLNFANAEARIGHVNSDDIERSIHFNLLICADGIKRHTVSVCNQDLPANNQIQFRSETHPSKRSHVSAYLEVRCQDGSPILPSREVSVRKLSDEEITFIAAFRPGNSLFTKKCNVTAELPPELSDEPCEITKKNAALAHLEKMMDTVMDEKTLVRIARSKTSPAKDKAKLSFFDIDLKQAENAMIEAYGIKIILMGDTQRTPNYQIGNGLNDALKQASLIGKCMRGEYLYDTYRDLCLDLGSTAACHTAKFASEPLELLDARIKGVLDGRQERKSTIEKLRTYFYYCFPTLEKYDISMFAMLHYRNENNQHLFQIAMSANYAEPLLLFKSLKYSSGICRTFTFAAALNDDIQLKRNLNI